MSELSRRGFLGRVIAAVAVGALPIAPDIYEQVAREVGIQKPLVLSFNLHSSFAGKFGGTFRASLKQGEKIDEQFEVTIPKADEWTPVHIVLNKSREDIDFDKYVYVSMGGVDQFLTVQNTTLEEGEVSTPFG